MKESFLFPYAIHPKAKSLLNEDFYFNTEETHPSFFKSSPFGTEVGFYTLRSFIKWREHFPDLPAISFANSVKVVMEPGFYFDPDETDPQMMKDFLSNCSLGYTILRELNQQIIATGFAIFILEGEMDLRVKEWTKKAIERELYLKKNYDLEEKGAENLYKMLSAVEKIK